MKSRYAAVEAAEKARIGWFYAAWPRIPGGRVTQFMGTEIPTPAG
jgi:hypothetical protein